jgi:molybdenum cofactor cytidylyltransferase
MGRFKPLLPLGDKTVLARAVGNFQAAGVERVLVVLGNRAEELLPLVNNLGAEPVLNPEFEQGMYSSVATGAAALPPGCGAFFVLPVDIPLVRVSTLHRLLAAWSQGKAQVLIPSFQGEPGHPPLIAASLAPAMAAWRGDGGLRGFLQGQTQAQVPVADLFMLHDLDTDDDYQALLKELPDYDLPFPAECLALLQEVRGVEPGLLAHSQAVANLALALGRELAQKGIPSNPRLIAAGGLLHDIAKGQNGHAAAGARLLHEMGFERVAKVVGAHVDLEISLEDPLDEAQLVHLADKLLIDDQLCSLEQRFSQGLERHGADPTARAHIQRRWENARLLQDKVEAALGRGLKQVLPGLNLAGEEFSL